jgi:hypothetical protein
VGLGDLGQGADVVHDAGRRLRLRGEDHVDAGVGVQQAVDLGRVQAGAPAGLVADDIGAVGLPHLDPALAELPRRAREDAVSGANEVGDGGLHGARAAGREQLHVVGGLEHRGEPAQHARVQLHPGRRPVVEDGLGHHLRHARRQRRRAGGHQVLLGEGIGVGHGVQSSVAFDGSAQAFGGLGWSVQARPRLAVAPRWCSTSSRGGRATPDPDLTPVAPTLASVARASVAQVRQKSVSIQSIIARSSLPSRSTW